MHKAIMSPPGPFPHSLHRHLYIDSTRVESMTTDYPIDMGETFKVLGRGSFSLQDGINQTTQWLFTIRGWRPPA